MRVPRLIVILATVLALLTGCATGTTGGAGGTPTPSPTVTTAPKFTVGLTYTPDIQFAPFYVGIAKGWFKEAGLDVQVRHHGSSESLLGALNAGAEDIVFAGGDEMMQARSQDTDVVNFATIYRQYPVVALVPESSTIRSAADLKGRSVGLPGPYGENWFALLVLLQRAGLTQADVSIQNIGYTQQAALTGGKVDAVIGFANNDAVRFQRSGFPVRAIPIIENGPTPLVGAGLGALGSTVTSRETDLRTLVSVVRRSIQFCIDNPEEAVKLSVDQIPGLTGAEQQAQALATLKATIPLYGTGNQIASQNEAAWTQMADFMLQSGLLAKPVAAADAHTARISAG